MTNANNQPNDGATAQLGLMGSDPETGECFAAYMTAPSFEEYPDLLDGATLFERRPLAEIKAAFGECDRSRQIIEYGPVIGQFEERPIHERIKTADGLQHVFSHVCQLRNGWEGVVKGALVLAPGIVFCEG